MMETLTLTSCLLTSACGPEVHMMNKYKEINFKKAIETKRIIVILSDLQDIFFTGTSSSPKGYVTYSVLTR